METELQTASPSAYVIDHWSYSSMLSFLRNRMQWKKEYVMKVWDNPNSPASVVGKACHIAAAKYLENGKINEAIDFAQAYIFGVQDENIDFGKTGSREKILKDFTNGFNIFLTEKPKFNKIIGIEKNETVFIKVGEIKLALPAKGIIDVVDQDSDEEIDIYDHKFVSCYTEQEEENAAFFLQAMFNFHVAYEVYGKAPRRMVFCEYKLSKNKDGTAQRQDYVIDYAKHMHYFQAFYNLYNECTAEIARPDCRYLPNFSDMMNGNQSFKDYVMNLIDIQTPLMIQHKNTPVVIEERKFIESAATKTDNAFLPAEEKIRLKLQEFALPVQMEKTHVGASVTLYTMKPARGCKMSAFENHAKDLALALEAKTIRIEAPIMGTSLVGVEVPNKDQSKIDLLNDGQLVMEMPNDGKLNIPIGVDVYGNTIIRALDDMPHLLIAGTTGAGKSVILNSIIRVISMTNPVEAIQMILIDPKRVEFAQFKDLPHLLAPIIVDDEKAAKALQWLCGEMEERYSMLEASGCRNMYYYNQTHADKISKIVVVIDEFADLMMRKDELLSGLDIENLIVKIAQKARAVGIHLVIGTQTPRVEVVTGRIKANITTRIALMTASQIDSRVILDESGAEQLIGHGDMLFMDPASKGLLRLQGFYC